MTRDEWIAQAVKFCIKVGFLESDALACCEAEYDAAEVEARDECTPEEYMQEAITYYDNDEDLT